MATSENVLLRRFVTKGDPAAFSEIVRRHAGLVYAVSMRVLGDRDKAADAVQETFFQFLRDAGRITGSIPAWLHRVAAGKAMDRIRNESSRRRREAGYADSRRRRAESWADIAPHVDRALGEMDAETRDLLIEHYLQGRSMTDIARRKGLSHPTVSRRIESGLGRLRANLSRRGIVVPAAALGSALLENAAEAAPAGLVQKVARMGLVGTSATKACGLGAAASASGSKALFGGLATAFNVKVAAAAAVALIAAGSLVAYRRVGRPVDPDKAAVLEMLDKCSAGRKKLKSYILKSETFFLDKTITLFGGRKMPNKGIPANTVEKRTDGTRFYVCEKDPTALEIPQSLFIPGDLKSRTWVWDGRAYYFYGGRSQEYVEQVSGSAKSRAERERLARRMSGSGIIYADPKNPRTKKMIAGRHPGIFSDGGVRSVLRKARSISLSDKTEVLNGSECRIIDAEIGRDKYKVWIDPAHGHNIAKVIRWRDGKETYRVWNVVFKRFDGVWVPVEQDFKYSNSGGRGSEDRHRYRVTELILNPDHDALKSFVPAPKEGSVVRLQGCAGIDEKHEYRWQGGNVVDAAGRPIEY